MSDNFYLELHLSTRERSKDSHGRSRSLIIKDGLASYSFRSFGMHSRPAKEQRSVLSKADQDELITYITRHKINRNLEEVKKDAGLGTSISLSIKMQIGNTVTEALVSGAYNDWRQIRNNKPPSNLENLNYHSEVKGLLEFMRKNSGFTAIEP